MRTVELTHGMRAFVDDEDFLRVSQFKWHAQCNRSGNWYAERTVSVREKQRMHRLIIPCIGRVDHKNGDGLDNRKDNLRPATAAQNGRNRRPNRSASGGSLKGITRKGGGRWQAQIQIGPGRKKYLGRFGSPIEAAAQYDFAAKIFFGEFAKLNFP